MQSTAAGISVGNISDIPLIRLSRMDMPADIIVGRLSVMDLQIVSTASIASGISVGMVSASPGQDVGQQCDAHRQQLRRGGQKRRRPKK